MPKRLVVLPDGWPCKMSELRPGLFTWKGFLCFKSEYVDGSGKSDAFVCSTGEAFWGGTHAIEECNALEVQPVKSHWETYDV